MQSKTSTALVSRAILIAATLFAVFASHQPIVGTLSGSAAERVAVDEFQLVITGYCRPTKSVVYSPSSGKIYASIPSLGPDGNSIARIDPVTGIIERTTWIGSEPNKLELAVDGTTIFAGLDGAFSIRKFDTATETSGDQFSGGMSPIHGPMQIRDFALSPANPDVVAVSRTGISPESVAIFDNGVQRPNVGGRGRTLSFTSEESTVYGFGSSPLKLSVDAGGISSVTFVNSSAGGTIVRALGDRLYTSSGQIVRASDGAVIGTFPLASHSGTIRPFVLDAAANRIIYVARSYQRLRIEAFDLKTFQLQGDAQVDMELESDPISAAKWGTNGLAISMKDAPTHFVQSDLIGPGTILPPATLPAPITIPQPSAFIRQLAIPNNDLLFNPRDKLLYLTVPANPSDSLSNSVTRVDGNSGTIVSSVTIGEDPHKMALSDDGKTLYAALHGACAVRRFDTVTQTPGLQFEIPNRFEQPRGLAVIPGSPESVAIGFGNAGLWIFDNGVYRGLPIEWQSFGEVVHNGTPNVLYATSWTYPVSFYKIAVSSNGPTVVSRTGQYGLTDIALEGGRIYSAGRRIIDPETNVLLGGFDENDLNVLAIDAETGKAFLAGKERVDVFDINSFNKIGTIPLPSDENTGDPNAIVRWGHNGLAISSTNSAGGARGLILIRSTLVGATRPFDFDGDGKTDLGVFRPSGGEWWINSSENNTTFAIPFGAASDLTVPTDYTGDGKADVAVWRPESGEWFVLRSEDFSYYSFLLGTSADVPVPADYDADGRADAAVFHPPDATWYVRRSSDGATSIQHFGAAGDIPVPSDYDGDGKADVAIFRPSLGQWWIDRSSAGVIVMNFGGSNDKPVQGDFTGDGISDVAFWRPTTGEWFVLRSEDFSFYSIPLGLATDVPAPGDYDGDGKFDATVFRPSTATWYSQHSTGGTSIQQFGMSGDRALPSVFVP